MKHRSNKETGPEQGYSRADLDARFSFTKWIVWASTVAIGLLFAFSYHAVFMRLNMYLADTDGTADIRLLLNHEAGLFFSLFGSVTLSWEITLQLWSIFGDRREADLFAYWSGLGVRFRYSPGPADYNVRKILRWMALLIALPIGILEALALPVHTTFRQDDIRDCGYAFSPCKTYSYAGVRRMTMIQGIRDRDGKLLKDAGIVIDFYDGRRISSARNRDLEGSTLPAFAEFLQRKTRLPLNYAETEDDIPRLNIEPEPRS